MSHSMDSGVGDIIERDSNEKLPEPPKQSGKKAFTKKWISRKRPVVLDPTAGQPTPKTTERAQKSVSCSEPPLSEPERIHLENIRKLQQMSPEEIEREREEIFKVMDPGVLQSLLRRAQLKEDEANAQTRKPESNASSIRSKNKMSSHPNIRATGGASPAPLAEPRGTSVAGTSAPSRGSVASWDPAPETVKSSAGSNAPSPNVVVGGAESSVSSSTIHPNSDSHLHSHTNAAAHFPPPPEELRQYFPNLPVETEKLAWMQPIDESEEAEYSAGLTSIAPSELRFDFNGNIITPRQSRAISTKAGLHHHGDAPSAAGYTLPELAHLSRSTHPAQRALAIQTAGRVLHKLRLRKFARSSEIQEGLEALVDRTRILDSLEEAADEKTRSLTVRTAATEALWLAKTHNQNTNNDRKEQE